MDNLSFYGLIVMILMLIPNIIYALLTRGQAKKAVSVPAIIENIGKFGSIVTMAYTFGFTTVENLPRNKLAVWILCITVLLEVYFVFWLIYYLKGKLFSIPLSTIPCAVFILTGIITVNIPLICFAAVFAVFHICDNIKNMQNHKKN